MFVGPGMDLRGRRAGQQLSHAGHDEVAVEPRSGIRGLYAQSQYASIADVHERHGHQGLAHLLPMPRRIQMSAKGGVMYVGRAGSHNQNTCMEWPQEKRGTETTGGRVRVTDRGGRSTIVVRHPTRARAMFRFDQRPERNTAAVIHPRADGGIATAGNTAGRFR